MEKNLLVKGARKSIPGRGNSLCQGLEVALGSITEFCVAGALRMEGWLEMRLKWWEGATCARPSVKAKAPAVLQVSFEFLCMFMPRNLDFTFGVPSAPPALVPFMRDVCK